MQMLDSIVSDRQVDSAAKVVSAWQRTHRFGVAASVVLVLVAGLAWYFGSGGSSHPRQVAQMVPQQPHSTPRHVTDGVLRVPVPTGGTGSINRGFQGRHPVASILVGSFRFPGDWGAEHREDTPTVPRDGFLIVIGDFVRAAYSSDWPSVRRLHLPSSRRTTRVVSWNVRFGGRALRLSVRFGSVPDEQRRALVNVVLAGIRRL
jgi:hypothetical protein